jgi:hypothetical protein
MGRSSPFPPIRMEEKFDTSYRDSPAVHIGSRSLSLFDKNDYEQAYEGIHLAYTKPGDAIVLRNADPDYLKYWHQLVPDVRIFNLSDPHPDRYLSEVVLEAWGLLPWLQTNAPVAAQLFVFFSTIAEQQIARKLDIPLYGSPTISSLYGTKSGVGDLARAADMVMPDRRVCQTQEEIRTAIRELFAMKGCRQIIVKNNESIGGGWSRRVHWWEVVGGISDKQLASILKEIRFIEGKLVVVERWIEHVQAAVSAHIEIPTSNGAPVIRWGWQQLIAQDGVSYQGAIPLMLPQAAIDDFITQTGKLAGALRNAGAVGSYAPNFVITSQNQAILLELNARIPLSAFALSIVRWVKGAIGEGFVTQYVSVPGRWPFTKIRQVLKNAGILIERRNGLGTCGVVPFNVGLLPYGRCSLVAIAPTWDVAREIINYATWLLRQK